MVQRELILGIDTGRKLTPERKEMCKQKLTGKRLFASDNFRSEIYQAFSALNGSLIAFFRFLLSWISKIIPSRESLRERTTSDHTMPETSLPSSNCQQKLGTNWPGYRSWSRTVAVHTVESCLIKSFLFSRSWTWNNNSAFSLVCYLLPIPHK